MKNKHACEKCTFPLGVPKRKERDALVYTCSHCGHINLKHAKKKK